MTKRTVAARPNLLMLSILGGLICTAVHAQDAPEPGQKTWLAEYQARVEAAQLAEQLQRWDEAANVYKEVIDKFVPYESTLRISMARVLVKGNHPDAALASLDEAVRYGWIDPIGLSEDAVFTPLRDREEFSKTLAKCRAAQNETCSVVVPENAAPDKPLPLIIALHGRGENNVAFQWYWREAALKVGAVLAVPRGPKRLSPIVYAWDEAKSSGALSAIDLAGSKRAVDDAISTAKRRATIDESRIVLVGFSQGGTAALRLGADAPARFARLIAMNPVGSQYTLDAVTKATTKPRVFIFTGELDRLRAEGQAARDAWKAAGAQVEYDEAKDSGHEPPPDVVDRQVRALRALLKE